MTTTSIRIAFIGGGNMARSMIGGLVQGGIAGSQLAVAEPNAPLRAALTADFGVSAHAEAVAAARGADAVVLAVKPQVMKAVCQDLGSAGAVDNALIVSIAAGIRIDQIERWLGAAAAVVRAMPNTPALIGAGACGLVASRHVRSEQRELAQRILGATGLTVWIGDEALMDTVTALSGSGPAYFFLLVEALEEAAVAQGLARDAARALAVQTCLGAGRMLSESGESPGELRRRVTSPNGTTQAAVESFERDDLRALATRAIAAATERGRQLSAEFGDND